LFGLTGRSQPKPANWDNRKQQEWLLNHPITAPQDIEFVTQQITDFDTLFKAGIKERAWVGQKPFLHLYHAMMDDNVLKAYADIHRAKDRAELDGRNSSERPLDFFKLAAKLYNRPEFNPVTT
jgi:hypothetical protein